MRKIIIVWFLFLTASKGQVSDINSTYQQILEDIKKQLNDLDTSLMKHSDIYKISLKTLQNDADKIERTFDEFESNFEVNKKCDDQYRKQIPNIENVKKSADGCWDQFVLGLTPFISSLLRTRNSLEKYWSEYYEVEKKTCGELFDKSTENYTSCIDIVKTNIETFINKHIIELNILAHNINPSITEYSKRFLTCNQDVEDNANSRYFQIKDSYLDCLRDDGIKV